MSFPKPKKWENKAYRMWVVASLPCSRCGIPADHAHHAQVSGMGKGMATKVSDHLCLPLCAPCHDHIHRNRDEQYETLMALRTIERALIEGVLK